MIIFQIFAGRPRIIIKIELLYLCVGGWRMLKINSEHPGIGLESESIGPRRGTLLNTNPNLPLTNNDPAGAES